MTGYPDNGVFPLQTGLFLPEHLPHPALYLVPQHSMSQLFAHSRPQLVLSVFGREHVKDPVPVRKGTAFFIDLLEPLVGLDPVGLGIFHWRNILFQSPAPAL